MKRTMYNLYIQCTRYILFLAIIIGGRFSYATELFNFGDAEKPKPEFSWKEDVISAKFIPRAKSTSVIIQFAVTSGGKLMAVKGVDFQTIDRPEVNIKNFKSAAFEMRIGHIQQGKEVKISIRSDFFTSSTAFYAFNPHLEKPWITTEALNLSKANRIRELVVTAVDGGPMDADGKADGNLILIGGPRDSFWGYALGTLFIRFFGIFIVLGILMVGMILSGIFFRIYEQRKKYKSNSLVSSPAFVTEEEVAVIAVALHLHFKHFQSQTNVYKTPRQTNNLWAAEGRKRMMNERLNAFNRFHRYNK